MDTGSNEIDSPDDASYHVDWSVDFAIGIGLDLAHSEYEPEQFPELVYRLDDPQVVLLLFGSGKLVITGAQTRDDIDQALVRSTGYPSNRFTKACTLH